MKAFSDDRSLHAVTRMFPMKTFIRPALTRSRTSVVVFLACVSGASLAAQFQTISVPDPATGLVQGQLPILPGWKGSATVDRTSDPLGNGTAALSIDVQSPEGTRAYRMLPVAFHTYSPTAQAMRLVKPQQPGAYLVFRSTADVLTQSILPRLNLGGEVSAPFPIDRERFAQIAVRVANGQTPPFTDTAAVIVKSGNDQETLVEASTFAMARGTPSEMTITHVQLFRAPAGQARALHDEIARLPEMQRDPQWVQADQALFQSRMAALRRQGDQIRAQTANNDAAFEAWKRSSAAQRSSYDQYNAVQAHRRQATSDSNAAFAGYVGDHDVSYKWCNASTGATQYVTNSTQSPGYGFQRCS